MTGVHIVTKRNPVLYRIFLFTLFFIKGFGFSFIFFDAGKQQLPFSWQCKQRNHCNYWIPFLSHLKKKGKRLHPGLA
jgi:hypothetical protein